MKKNTVNQKIYPEYIKKYEGYDINKHKLEMVEELCSKTYEPSMGLNFDMYVRMNLYFEVLSQLYKEAEYLDVINKYKSVVVIHCDEIKKYLSKEEIDIIFEDTLDKMKENYDKTEALGSYIVRNFKNNLVDYVNESYNTNFSKIKEDDYKIKLLKK